LATLNKLIFFCYFNGLSCTFSRRNEIFNMMYPRIILFILLPLFGFSQAPQKINFQSILRNSGGEVVSNKVVSLRISILSGSINDSTVYSETHTKTTDASGLISIQIGGGTVVSGIFGNISWGNAAHFIKLEADFNGGSNYGFLGTQEIMSVPYALYASKTDTSVLNLANRFNSKVNTSDTASMLINYRNELNNKLNTSDTFFMLSNYWTGLNNKVSFSDTAAMLNPYLKKTDNVIVELQNQILQNPTKVTDVDGNSYKTVKIGNQIWMAENLKTSKYQNGNPITTNLDDLNWSTATSGAFAIYDNNTNFDTSYGKLYNWYAVSDNRGICPLGWHVPSQGEFIILIEYLGGANVAGGKLKLTGTTFWLDPNINATNESGFSAIGGGTRNSGGSYTVLNQIGFYWSSTENVKFAVVNNGAGTGLDLVSFKTIGYSVRCLKNAVGDFNQGLDLKLNISDTSTMLNPYLKKADAMVNVETDPVFNTSIAKGITGIDTAYWNRKTGNTTGNIQYWNGNEWVNLAPGLPGQVISMSTTGIPFWSGAAYPTLTTSSVSSITSTSAGVEGNISADGGASVSARGLVYGTASNPTLSNTVLSIGSGTGSFSGTLTGLTPNTTYYVRAYATNSSGTGYGNEVSFQTLPVAVPTLITTDASGITQTTVTSGGTISNDGGATITERGIVYGTSSDPTVTDTKISSEIETGSFSVNITSLTPNTTYYIRSYAINSAGTGYGNNITFQTTVPVIPSLTTREIINISNITATSGGSITNDGGSTISAKGICWSTSPNPTISDSKSTDGTGTATFTSFMTGLSASVTYYVRAYATNSTGTGYGNQQTFTTSSTSNTLPVVTSTSVTGLTKVQATFNGEVNSQGGGTVTERGAVWNTSGNPTVNSNRVPSGSGTGVYMTTITGLSGGSNYYVRAYAINNFGISYGVEIPFITLIGLSTLTTNNVIYFSTTASSGGNITDNGGSTVTARGVVWNTTGTPTISDSKTTDGSGTGTYFSSMTALSPGTTYYVRSYATNSTGTAYGNEISFTTTAISQPVTDIDGNTYNTVQIGTQVWMSENLKTSRYRNGGSIPYVVGNTDWQALTKGAWSNYDHDAANDAIYGKLYNWYTTLGDTLCPIGWHVPSDNEWTILTDYLGGESVAGGKMKSIGTNYWIDPNTVATNESGFSALPGGFRINYGSFLFIRDHAFFWSATEYDFDYAWNRYLNYNNSYVYRIIHFNYYYKSSGASVRCLKDQIPSLTTTSISQVTSTSAISGGNIIANGGSTVTARGVVWNTNGTPTISDNKTTDGSGTGSYVSDLTGLNLNTTYYVRAYATNSIGTAYGNEVSITTTAISQPVTDIDGNIYNTVQIGTQVWMSENLKTTRYRNGGSIPYVVENTDWGALTTGAWSNYDHDVAGNDYIYGKFYNWYTTLGDTLCPTGWGVPTDAEWTILTDYLGGESVAGGKMKATGTTYWDIPNSGATNESRFSALPGGFRDFVGSFDGIRNFTFFWSASENDNYDSWYRNIDYNYSNVFRNFSSKSFGFSVRCLKD
jgi:uncharacterized protein (TIGR02145 family)